MSVSVHDHYAAAVLTGLVSSRDDTPARMVETAFNVADEVLRQKGKRELLTPDERLLSALNAIEDLVTSRHGEPHGCQTCRSVLEVIDMCRRNL